ncbi:hypothetical protein [Mycobacteroides abscessus]|uniref:hypothetical protein n=1 Tax=Mycobacteroides abscessus TaxID=36809 RepID=UPI002102DE9D|nr:hypothetical protein [Mycobacteroides abscessus]
MTTIDGNHLADAVRSLLDEIDVLTADFGATVQAAVDSATTHPVDTEQAERLYTNVLRILRTARASGAAVSDEAISRDVRNLLRELPPDLAADDHVNPWGSVPLVPRNGLSPHPVTPIPSFNGKSIPMYEGYVDISQIGLWDKNHRVELQVMEFRDRNHREPEPEELLQLVQGKLRLPSLDKNDPYNIVALADSVARKGVVRPPILTSEGVPRDGNRRIAAAHYVLSSQAYRPEQKDNARWVKVWVAPPGTTEDLLDAVVVALNFEDDLREEWPEFIKARIVVAAYRSDRRGVKEVVTPAREAALRKAIGERYAIKTSEVTRYIKMVQWAEDFENYHVCERGRDAASVRYRADKIFQWFYEIQAGTTGDKITEQIEEDEELRRVVYDLMFDTMNAGTQVRSLWKVVADQEARAQLLQAHDHLAQQQNDDALAMVKEAVTTADRNNNKRKQIGFEGFLRSCVDRLGGAAPNVWLTAESALLIDVERVMQASFGVIEGLLAARGDRPVKVDVNRG